MAVPQLVVLTFLKPFFRVKEILLIITEQLETLTIALASTQSSDGPKRLSPEYYELLRPLRELGRTQCTNAWRLTKDVRRLSDAFAQAMGSLPIPTETKKMPDPVLNFTLHIKKAAERGKEAGDGMKQFSKEIIATVEKIMAVLNQGPKRAAPTTVLMETHSQTVNDLIQATEECRAIYRKISEYFRDAERHFQGDYLIGKAVPQDEIDTVRQRWAGFRKGLDPLTDSVHASMESGISRNPSIVKASIIGKYWKPTGMSNGGASPDSFSSSKAVLGASGPDVESSTQSVSTEPAPTLFGSLWHYVRSWFSFERSN
ncbi:hypothetical protein AN958_11206 [Leucoagaricus sp. SymC.cos]|nr:hypothetical protein AN958_11206 [Leucoagaricus sp. SymC.cos]